MGKFKDLVRRLVAVGVVLALVPACSRGTDGSASTSATDGWWESEPELAPENFDEQASESVDGDGARVSEAGVEVTVPGGVLDASVEVTIRELLGEFGSEFGGPIVGLQHDNDLDGAVAVEWDVSELTAAEQDTLLLVRWDDAQERWAPGDVEPEIEDGTLSAELDQWSFWSWIANAGQTGQEIIGRRADAPKCADGALHGWVAGVVDPDEDTNAAAVRVCFENDRDEIVAMRVVNNRTFGQFIHVDGSRGWEWTWTGEDELSAVQAVRVGAAAVFNDDRRVFVPPLHEIAVGIARPDTGGSHFIEFRNESTAETFLADVVMFAVSKLDIPTPGIERVGVLVEAVLNCALEEVVKGGAPTDLDAIARLVVSTVTSCIGEITDETSELGLAFRTMLSQRIAAYPNADVASEAMRSDRLLRSASRALRLLSVVEAITYLGDVAAEHLVGDLRWSLRGAGKNSPLGEWEPDCSDVDRDSNLIYRNLALQDEFSDTSIELHDFPRWPEAAAQAVVPLVTCDTDYLSDLAAHVRGDWGDDQAAAVVANAIDTLARPPVAPTWDELKNAEIPSVCGHPATRLADGRHTGIAEGQGFLTLLRESLASPIPSDVGPLTAVTASCSAGGVGFPSTIVFFKQGGEFAASSWLDEGNWVSAGLSGPARDGVEEMTPTANGVRVQSLASLPHDKACCPTGRAETELTVANGVVTVGPITSNVLTWLRADGFAESDFGTPLDTVIEVLRPRFGSPTDSRSLECPSGQAILANYEDFYLMSVDDQLTGWFYRGSNPPMTTRDGVAIGITASGIRDIHPDVEVFDSSLGKEFTYSTNNGYLGGFIEALSVVSLYGGQTCFFG